MVVVLSGELASALSRFIQCAGVYPKSKWRSKIRSGNFATRVVLLRSQCDSHSFTCRPSGASKLPNLQGGVSLFRLLTALG